MAECLHGGVGAGDGGRQFGVAALSERDLAQPGQVHFAAAGVQVQEALAQLGHLCHAAGDGYPRHGVAPQVLEHPADDLLSVVVYEQVAQKVGGILCVMTFLVVAA